MSNLPSYPERVATLQSKILTWGN